MMEKPTRFIVHYGSNQRVVLARSRAEAFSIIQGEYETEWGVGHCLDYDLITVAPTKNEALERLHICVDHYVQFGVEHGLQEHMAFPAPPAYWESDRESVVLNITIERSTFQSLYQGTGIAVQDRGAVIESSI